MPPGQPTTRPIFILGNPRSGTSLLGRMLNSHPGIAVPYEAHVYNVFWRWHKRYEPLTDPARRRRLAMDMLSMRARRYWSKPPGVEAVLERIERPSFHGVFEAMLNAWAAGQNKPRWGEKTPQNGPYWRVINEGFPDARFIHLVRDGRDCALSWIAANFGPKLTYPAAVKWARYVDDMQAMRDELGPHRVYELRYADLINDTESSLHAICDFLDEPFDPAMLEYHRADDTYMTERRNNRNLKQPVITDNAAKWKTRMSTRNQRIFEAVAGEQLRRYGYPLAHPNAAVTRWERLRDTYLLHPPLRMMSKLRNVKGWIDSLTALRVRLRLMTIRK